MSSAAAFMLQKPVSTTSDMKHWLWRPLNQSAMDNGELQTPRREIFIVLLCYVKDY